MLVENVNESSSAAMLATKRSADVVPEVNQGMYITNASSKCE